LAHSAVSAAVHYFVGKLEGSGRWLVPARATIGLGKADIYLPPKSNYLLHLDHQHVRRQFADVLADVGLGV
jgi:hypothetical protein